MIHISYDGIFAAFAHAAADCLTGAEVDKPWPSVLSFYIKLFFCKGAAVFWEPGSCHGDPPSITVMPPYVFPVGVVLITETEQSKDSR